MSTVSNLEREVSLGQVGESSSFSLGLSKSPNFKGPVAMGLERLRPCCCKPLLNPKPKGSPYFSPGIIRKEGRLTSEYWHQESQLTQEWQCMPECPRESYERASSALGPGRVASIYAHSVALPPYLPDCRNPLGHRCFPCCLHLPVLRLQGKLYREARGA